MKYLVGWGEVGQRGGESLNHFVHFYEGEILTGRYNILVLSISQELWDVKIKDCEIVHYKEMGFFCKISESTH